MTVRQIHSPAFIFQEQRMSSNCVLVLYSFFVCCYLHFDAGPNKEAISLTETANSTIQICAMLICSSNSEV